MFEGPSGSMGRPEDASGYRQFNTGEIQFYVQHEVFEQFLDGNRITFYLDEYGRYELELLDNIQGY